MPKLSLSWSILTLINLPIFPSTENLEICCIFREGNLDGLDRAVLTSSVVHSLRPEKLMVRLPVIRSVLPSPTTWLIALGNLKGMEISKPLPPWPRLRLSWGIGPRAFSQELRRSSSNLAARKSSNSIASGSP